MDLLCPKCNEPWDNDELHSVEGATYQEAARRFRVVGCEVFETTHSGGAADPRVSALYEVLGDDMDGAASMIEDFGLGGE